MICSNDHGQKGGKVASRMPVSPSASMRAIRQASATACGRTGMLCQLWLELWPRSAAWNCHVSRRNSRTVSRLTSSRFPDLPHPLDLVGDVRDVGLGQPAGAPQPRLLVGPGEDVLIVSGRAGHRAARTRAAGTGGNTDRGPQPTGRLDPQTVSALGLDPTNPAAPAH